MNLSHNRSFQRQELVLCRRLHWPVRLHPQKLCARRQVGRGVGAAHRHAQGQGQVGSLSRLCYEINKTTSSQFSQNAKDAGEGEGRAPLGVGEGAEAVQVARLTVDSSREFILPSDVDWSSESRLTVCFEFSSE